MFGNKMHEFHFVMNRGMKERLQGLDFFKGCKSVSGVIVKILRVLTPVLGKEHKWGEQRMSRYKAVCDDPEDVREHVHVYVPGELYRELKLLHHGLNFYSIAQLVRELVEFFMGLVEVYGSDVFRVLEEIFARWRSGEEQSRLTSRKFMRQLWKIIRFLPGKNRLITVYNDQYSPFWVLRV